MKIILHLVEDKKFLQASINKFSIDPSIRNIFISIGKLKYDKKGSTIIISLPTIVINKFIRFIHFFVRGVVIHGFGNSFFNVQFNKIHNKVKILGIFWGFDLYSINGSKEDFLMPETIKMNRGSHNFSKKFGEKKFIEFINQRIDFVSTIVPSENKILNSHFPKANFKFTWFSYFDLENDVLNGIQNKKLVFSGQNILYGNNSSLWNNHIDGIEEIKSFKFNFDKIICPLSYSGSVEYRQKVIEVFSNEFKNKFRPLTSFLKYSDYLQLLLSCPYVFFNSKRQIGLGNLLFSIYLGSVVILNSNNPLFHFFLSNGIKVFSIEEAQSSESFELDISKNRENLGLLFNEEALKERSLQVIQNLIEE
ncbi:TDP-N-acetylfucosamine:lipid II N-acetylfucosaminyltransferase [Cyclobacterium qasimii]|uniref:4-alpha-L-fucosyltransferase n=1 Tax=Cyclobacterium qasimii TaxID=1350429 RepID=A0A512C5Q7_9BACT|nr:TDP-N-acetylfucosamine:lipid II N-acetylfucosaminyltransferase [Cyclobacterium qasimii]GEO19531.1 hypothetical protein CQA01_00650 [Cyclobacterium qasimii]